MTKISDNGVEKTFCDNCKMEIRSGESKWLLKKDNSDYCSRCVKTYLFDKFFELPVEKQAEIIGIDWDKIGVNN